MRRLFQDMKHDPSQVNWCVEPEQCVRGPASPLVPETRHLKIRRGSHDVFRALAEERVPVTLRKADSEPRFEASQGRDVESPLVLGGETEDAARFEAGRKTPNGCWDTLLAASRRR